MRERLITLVCALGALLLFAALFVRGEGRDARRVALPTTVERHGNGLLGAIGAGTATNWPGSGADPETHVVYAQAGNTVSSKSVVAPPLQWPILGTV